MLIICNRKSHSQSSGVNGSPSAESKVSSPNCKELLQGEDRYDPIFLELIFSRRNKAEDVNCDPEPGKADTTLDSPSIALPYFHLLFFLEKIHFVSGEPPKLSTEELT